MLLNRNLTIKRIYCLGFIICCGLLIASFYFEFVKDLAPCSLCILQRVTVMVMGLILLIALFHKPKAFGYKIYSTLISLSALAGVLIAGRQVWLQYVPSAQPSSCGAGLTYMLKNLPLSQTLNLVFQGSGECDQITWQFLGLSMAAWMLIIFTGLSVLFISQIFRKA